LKIQTRLHLERADVRLIAALTFTGRASVLTCMGDKSPKANQKQASQNNKKNAASQKKKEAVTASKQIPKAKK